MNEETLSSSCSTSSSPSTPLSTYSPSPLTSVNSSLLSPPTTISSTSQSLPHSSVSTGFTTSLENFNLSSHSPTDCYVTAEARINDVPGIVLLDTGSGITIISSHHWKIIGSPDSIRPYNGPEIQGPDGSSIGPAGQVVVQITMAGVTVQHPAILAKHFHHLILLGNDYMKSIGLVLDLQANKMWLRQHPDRTYSISSDLTQAGRIDVPVISTERRTIAPYHVAFIQVNVPHSLSSHSWDASITGHRPHLATANSLIRFTNGKSFVQIANCSPRQQHVYCGQHVALADLYLDESDPSSDVYQLPSSTTNSLSTLSLSPWESPMPLFKEGFTLNTISLDHGSLLNGAPSLKNPIF
jgi:hypothetical protein